MTEAESRARSRCQEHEGCRLTAYRDSVGVLTLGIGHRVTKADCDRWGVGHRDHVGLTDKLVITQEEAMELFEKDWANAKREAGNLIALRSAPPCGEPRYYALAEMTFQLGPAGLGRFRKMWDAISRNHWLEAAYEALDSRWAIQTPKRARTLARILRTGSDA